jgi:hypothetical protein
MSYIIWESIEKFTHYFQENFFDLVSALIWSIVILAIVRTIKYLETRFNFISLIRDIVVGVCGYSKITIWRNEFDRYRMYIANKALINQPNNITIYSDKQRHYFITIQKYAVFKKCIYTVNEYYWSVKSNDKNLFYTTSDNEKETLANILRQTKLTILRGKVVNVYFECCLLSYLLNENTELLSKLIAGEEVESSPDSKIFIKTQDWFTKHNTSGKMPDVAIRYLDEEKVIIDAYNGSNRDEIKRKISMYVKAFPDSTVFVFASCTTALGQFVAANPPSFKLFTIRNESLIEIEEIKIGSMNIQISDLNSQYLDEYQVFRSEVFYWQSCESQKRIVASRW